MAFPIDPNHHRPFISCITLMTRPLISDATGVALSPLWLGKSLKNVGVEFGLESAKSEEVSGLPSEEVEVLEQPSEGVLGEESE